MNQQRLKAYLDVIQGLLSCPQGEEWILLRQNQELVNLELVEVMEQVAHHLTAQGDTKAAKYLHNWAGKLHHILTDSVPLPQKNPDKTQAYIELIQALLSCPDGSEAEILAANQDLIGPELVKVMQQIASKMASEGDRETANVLNNLATDLNRTWLQHHEFEPTYKQEIASDPWLDEDADLSTTETTSKSLAATDKATEKSPSLSSPAQTEKDESLPELLAEICDSLIKLETILASRLQPTNPLWYMDVLEKAEAANWILTTDEVEQLIGIKPHCHHDETSFHRGSWVFVKSGKVGAQMGWKVQKNQGG
ncbi:hypothetical protein IQ255_11220 [Pleurocapsales cyanobacterium LEGE 10410]|nr:hypothetical protein [Pleurocapsales cyanobacterium LEGE 10410]